MHTLICVYVGGDECGNPRSNRQAGVRREAAQVRPPAQQEQGERAQGADRLLHEQ